MKKIFATVFFLFCMVMVLPCVSQAKTRVLPTEETLNQYAPKISAPVKKWILVKNYRIRINTKTSSKHGDFNKKKKMFSFHSKKAMKKQIYHEIGHMLVSDMKGMSYSFNLKRAIRDERSRIYGKNTKLAKKNRYEYFAWGYEQYIKNSKKLKKRCPKTWLLMDLSSKCVYQQYAYFKDLDEKQLYSESDWWLGEHVFNPKYERVHGTYTYSYRGKKHYTISWSSGNNPFSKKNKNLYR